MLSSPPGSQELVAGRDVRAILSVSVVHERSHYPTAGATSAVFVESAWPISPIAHASPTIGLLFHM
jgi:hypothetical protein